MATVTNIGGNIEFYVSDTDFWSIPCGELTVTYDKVVKTVTFYHQQKLFWSCNDKSKVTNISSTSLYDLASKITALTCSASGGGGGGGEVTLPSDYFEAGGRLKTAEVTMLGEYSHIFDKQTGLKDEKGTGTGTWEQGKGIKMSVTAGQYLIRESIYSHYYSKGNGQSYENTTENFQLESGVVKFMGYFSSSTTAPYNTGYDGMFLEANGDDNEYYLNLRNNGTIVLRKPRSEWTDKLDGSGASGLTIDFSKFNISSGDFLWLGGKAARFILAAGGKFVTVYEHPHAGEENGLIMNCPNQPIRYEIRSTTGTGFIYDICSRAATEGSINSVGIPRGVDLDALTVNANIIGDYYALVGFRVNQLRRNSVLNILGFGAFATSNDAFRTTIFKNPTFNNASPSWQDYSTESGLQYFLGDVINNPSQLTITGGEKLQSFGVSQRSGEATLDLKDVLFQLTRNIDNTSDVYVIAVTPLTPNLDISGQGQILERIL